MEINEKFENSQENINKYILGFDLHEREDSQASFINLFQAMMKLKFAMPIRAISVDKETGERLIMPRMIENASLPQPDNLFIPFFISEQNMVDCMRKIGFIKEDEKCDYIVYDFIDLLKKYDLSKDEVAAGLVFEPMHESFKFFAGHFAYINHLIRNFESLKGTNVEKK